MTKDLVAWKKHRAETHKKWREANRERISAIQRSYYKRRKEQNPDFNHEMNYKFRVNNPEKYLYQNAKSRAKKEGFEFNIDVSDISIPEVCPVLGIPLLVHAGKGQQPNSPSLDRIESSKGYIKGNVQVMSWRANSLKSDGSLEEFEKLVEFLRG